MKRQKLSRGVERWDLADERRRQVQELYTQGYRQTEIADQLGITQARVSQIMLGIERNRTNKRKMLRLMPVEPVGASA